jgi:hypothetical protein
LAEKLEDVRNSSLNLIRTLNFNYSERAGFWWNWILSKVILLSK